MESFPCSGEINFKVKDTENSINSVKKHFAAMGECHHTDNTDGLSIEFSEWRLNLRGSNTEPLLRLNIESHKNNKLVKQKVKLVSNPIKS